MKFGKTIGKFIACTLVVTGAAYASEGVEQGNFGQGGNSVSYPRLVDDDAVGDVTTADKGHSAACDTGACDTSTGSCPSCGEKNCMCCASLSQHRTGVFGEFLYLRPGNVDVVYAVEQTSFDPQLASPTGPVGRVAPGNGAGFRLGGNWELNDCASLVATYSWLESDTEDTITAAPGNVLDLTVGHPSVITSGATSIAASSTYDIGFQTLDLDYRALLWGNCNAALNYSLGMRYAHLEQAFLAQQEIFAAAGLTTVATQIDFDGFGIRAGLDGTKQNAETGILVYAKAYANFVGGEFKADFTQSNQFGGTAVVGNDFADYRVVTILESEVGMGWQSCNGRVRVTGGYAVTGWLNTLTTGSYINGVQTREYDQLGETLTFDGLVTRVEVRF